MSVQEKLYTADEFWEFVSLPENEDKFFELIEGVIYEVNPPRPIHVVTSGRIFGFFFIFNETHQLGFVTVENGGYELSPGNVLIPDVGFISFDKVPTLPDKFTLAPDIAVEVVSPSNRPREILDKVELYLRYGTRFVWVVYPKERVVDVYRTDEDGGLHIQKFTEADTLDGGDVLPGFTLAVRDIFPKQ